MYFIRSCPYCNESLRFPLDRGTLQVTCPSCRGSFRVDPDSPDTYRIGHFDSNQPLIQESKLKKSWNLFLDILYVPIDIFSTLFPSRTNAGSNLKKIIPFLLFFLLGIYMFRMCGSGAEKNIPKNKGWTPPNIEENQEWDEERTIPEKKDGLIEAAL